MTNRQPQTHSSANTAADSKLASSTPISTLGDLAKLADYSLMDSLNCDPEATETGDDHYPRQVFSGHYVPVKPTPIQDPEYIGHSKQFFSELGFADNLAHDPGFIAMFSGDMSQVPEPMKKFGWATGYALSIYGTEYTQQCPFRTGNGYGDGRAVSVLEGVINGKRWEMQLKGGGPTPYCRGADGRAVLRSSVREFLAQENMHALGVPTSRSLSFYVSKSETVDRPWYSEGSRSEDPDRLVSEAVAISTRVAPSFLRVGQLELFARRVRANEHSQAFEELEKIVLHLIDREYADVIDEQVSTPEKVVILAREFRSRLMSLIANWIRVGFCQGNFNSDNCAAGGFTLDYGPFGFCDVFHPYYQPWTGGGQHFSFMNQTNAAQKNFGSFCSALSPLLESHPEFLQSLNEIEASFPKAIQSQMERMWATKLGLGSLSIELKEEANDEFKEELKKEFRDVLNEVQILMMQTPVDYTLFFRELSSIPEDIGPLKKSFYTGATQDKESIEMDQRWSAWLAKWKALLNNTLEANTGQSDSLEAISVQMKLVNPKYILREWLVVPAYQQAAKGDYTLIQELQEVMTQPYAEQSQEIEDKYYRLKPREFFAMGGVSHLSCSS
ncbi:conserved hypotheical protein [Marinomonas sp. MED121]|uniref:protein adenylyltransferase SelO n=1 Tax=Marinomonas sp. MED121 TaxID=314277 RepID=UPI0000690187|nr:protein adenylyltransferase SelO family protein [Marinomonas sp. MED121]EAQ64333.1 conserved hypotheical protein [Marinomonas sp. MED121]